MNFDELIDDVIDLGKKYTIISGYCDVINHESQHHKCIKKIDKDSYYTIIGCFDDEMIEECISEYEIDYDEIIEGEYNFYAVFTYDGGDVDEYGRYTMRPYLEVEYIRWDFIQTFEQRDRDFKLNQILESDFDIFNI